MTTSTHPACSCGSPRPHTSFEDRCPRCSHYVDDHRFREPFDGGKRIRAGCIVCLSCDEQHIPQPTARDIEEHEWEAAMEQRE